MNRASLKRASWSGAIRGLVAAFPLASVMVLLHLASGGTQGTALAPHEVAGLLTLTGILAASIGDLGRVVELAIPARISGKRLLGRLAEIEPLVVARETSPAKGAPLVCLGAMKLGAGGTGFFGEIAKGDFLTLDAAGGGEPGQLVEVLAGLQAPPAGKVHICGRTATGLGQRQRRQWIGIAAPWAGLLQGTLADNLGYRMRRGGGMAELGAMMDRLCLSHLADRDGNPLPLRLRDEGSSLPPADLAAIRLLRAMIGKPRLLLLDRASRDLTRQQVEGLAQLLSGWRGAVVMTGERPQLRALCNRRWTVGQDEIREEEGNDEGTAIPSVRAV